jgi:hypothetical protein
VIAPKECVQRVSVSRHPHSDQVTQSAQLLEPPSSLVVASDALFHGRRPPRAQVLVHGVLQLAEVEVDRELLQDLECVS